MAANLPCWPCNWWINFLFTFPPTQHTAVSFETKSLVVLFKAFVGSIEPAEGLQMIAFCRSMASQWTRLTWSPHTTLVCTRSTSLFTTPGRKFDRFASRPPRNIRTWNLLGFGEDSSTKACRWIEFDYWNVNSKDLFHVKGVQTFVARWFLSLCTARHTCVLLASKSNFEQVFLWFTHARFQCAC